MGWVSDVVCVVVVAAVVDVVSSDVVFAAAVVVVSDVVVGVVVDSSDVVVAAAVVPVPAASAALLEPDPPFCLSANSFVWRPKRGMSIRKPWATEVADKAATSTFSILVERMMWFVLYRRDTRGAIGDREMGREEC